MRLNNPLDKILNNEIKVRILRIFCRNAGEMTGRQIAKLTGVTPKTAHEILQGLLHEGALTMRAVGKSYLFRLREDRTVIRELLKPLFSNEKAVSERLFDAIRKAIKKSPLRDDILSVALFGSVHAQTDQPTSDLDLFVVVKTAELKQRAEILFSSIDQQLSSQWGNLISPYINSLAEFKTNAPKKTGPVSNILKSYQLIYGDRLEKILR